MTTPAPLPQPDLTDLTDIGDDETTSTTAEARSVATAAIGDPPDRRRKISREGYAGPPRRSTTVASGRGMVERARAVTQLDALAAYPGAASNEIAEATLSIYAAVRASALGDMKAGLTSGRPKLSIVPAAGELYTCRAMEYGDDKYARGNYHGSPPEGVSPAARVMGYVDAAIRHLRAVASEYNRACGVRTDVSGYDECADALCTPDDVASGGFPASGLPHLAHALASLAIGVQCGVDDGLLPPDPGQPWKNGDVVEERSPEAVARFGR
jgi:hypothetical protein